MEIRDNRNVIALFMPAKTSFYEGLFESIKKAFEQHKYKVVGGCSFLEDKELELFIYENKPKVFFEMNRCKSEIDNFPKDILHICWLVDLSGRKLENIQGSEIIYFFSVEWMRNLNPLNTKKTAWLPPASDPQEYYPIEGIEKKFKTIFLGHIPNPWNNELLERVVYEGINNKTKFSDVLDKFEKKWAMQDKIVNNDVYIKEVISWLDCNRSEQIDIKDAVLRYDIGCRIIRKARREYFIDWLLTHSDVEPLGIFGGVNWTNWSKYNSFYQNELHTRDEINTALNSAKLLIHEGVGLHFRVLDAMLCGVPVIMRKSEQDALFGGIGTIFEEGRDYISIDISDKESQNMNITNEMLNEIASNAREKVLSNHTWFHRLSKVVEDIDALGR